MFQKVSMDRVTRDGIIGFRDQIETKAQMFRCHQKPPKHLPSLLTGCHQRGETWRALGRWASLIDKRVEVEKEAFITFEWKEIGGPLYSRFRKGFGASSLGMAEAI
jgi:hypothetical protein